MDNNRLSCLPRDNHRSNDWLRLRRDLSKVETITAVVAKERRLMYVTLNASKRRERFGRMRCVVSMEMVVVFILIKRA